MSQFPIQDLRVAKLTTEQPSCGKELKSPSFFRPIHLLRTRLYIMGVTLEVWLTLLLSLSQHKLSSRNAFLIHSLLSPSLLSNKEQRSQLRALALFLRSTWRSLTSTAKSWHLIKAVCSWGSTRLWTQTTFSSTLPQLPQSTTAYSNSNPFSCSANQTARLLLPSPLICLIALSHPKIKFKTDL